MAPIQFTIEELRDFTHCFNEEYMLGSGNFGRVYQGLWDDKRILVKVSNCDLDLARYQWEAEKRYLSEIQHPHIIELIGYGKDNDKFILVYEYMLCTVTEVLAGLDWLKTLKILREAALALHYIHKHSHPSLVFVCLKADNILIDEKYNVKLSDFGCARKEGMSITYSIPGYADPKIIMRGKVATPSFDIYSFGVVILQLIMKKDKVRDRKRIEHITDWAREEVSKKNYAVHEMLCETGCGKQDAIKITSLAMRCLSENVKSRPTMSEVIEVLEQLQAKTLVRVMNEAM